MFPGALCFVLGFWHVILCFPQGGSLVWPTRTTGAVMYSRLNNYKARLAMLSGEGGFEESYVVAIRNVLFTAGLVHSDATCQDVLAALAGEKSMHEVNGWERFFGRF